MTTDQNPTLPPCDMPAPPPPSAVAPPNVNVLAIVGFIASFFFALVGIICSAVALRQIARTGERGRGLAIGGIVVGALGIVVTALVTVLITVGATSAATSGGRTSMGFSSSSSKDCARLEEAATTTFNELQGADSIKGAAEVDGVAAKLTTMAGDFRKVASGAADRDVADAADAAASAVIDFAEAMSDAAAPGATSDVTETGQTLVSKLKGIGDICG